MPLLDCTKRASKINVLDKSSRTKWEFADAVDCDSTLNVDGATTLVGAVGVTGALTVTGASSDISRVGANAQTCVIKQATTSVNMATATGTGTGTITITNLIPANSIVLGVTARVTTILAGASLTTWSLGITSHTDHYGTTLALAAGTTVTPADHKVADIPGPHYVAAATSLLMTAAAGVFSTGVLRVTVHYIQLTAETS